MSWLWNFSLRRLSSLGISQQIRQEKRRFCRKSNENDLTTTFNLLLLLPLDVFHLLMQFLTRKSFLSLITTNKQAFSTIYRSLPTFILKEEYCRKFILRRDFREYLYQRLLTSQIGLTIQGYFYSEPLLSIFLPLLNEFGAAERGSGVSAGRSLFLSRLHTLALERVDEESLLAILEALHSFSQREDQRFPLKEFLPSLHLRQIRPSPTSSTEVLRSIPLNHLTMFREVVLQEMDYLNLCDVSEVKNLSIQQCRQIQTVNYLNSVTKDAGFLIEGKWQWILTNCSFRSPFPSFSQIHSLHLHNCDQFSAACLLANISFLRVEYDSSHYFYLQQYNWSSLSVVQFIGCRFVRFHPAFLLDCKKATFEGCSFSEDWRLLQNPERVYLYFRDESFSSLPSETRNIKLWSVNNCSFSPSVSTQDIETFFRGIDSVPSISLLNGLEIRTIEGLGRRNLQVTISACHALTDFSPLCQVPYLHIINCEGFTDICQVRKVRTLVIERCDGLQAVHSLEQIFRLELCDCFSLRALTKRQNIPILQIRHCPNLVDISGMKVKERLEVISCQSLTRLPSLAAIPSIFIEDCPVVLSL